MSDSELKNDFVYAKQEFSKFIFNLTESAYKLLKSYSVAIIMYILSLIALTCIIALLNTIISIINSCYWFIPLGLIFVKNKYEQVFEYLKHTIEDNSIKPKKKKKSHEVYE